MKNRTSFICLLLFVFIVGQNCASNNKKVKLQKTPNQSKKNTQTTKQNQENFQALIAANTATISQLEAKLNYMEETLAYYKAGNTAENTLDTSIYNKKIILNNGSTLYGNITFQDDNSLQIETVIGTLTIDKNSIIRVVDYQISQINQEHDMININLMQHTQTNQTDNNQFSNVAKVILIGEFLETKDANNNTILSGEVKNIGKKRADFAKITFTIFKDTKHNTPTAEYTTFISGSERVFERNIISNSSLYSNETGTFSLVIPSDFGPFLSYSYIMDWEQYD